jgi:hypothetical protein
MDTVEVMDNADFGLVVMETLTGGFPPGTVEVHEEGVNMDFTARNGSWVKLRVIFSDEEGVEVHVSPMHVLGQRMYVDERKKAWIELSDAEEFHSARIERRSDLVYWTMPYENQARFLRLVKGLAETVAEWFEPWFVAERVASGMLAAFPAGSWRTEARDLWFYHDREQQDLPLLWLTWSDVDCGVGVVVVHLGPVEVFGSCLHVTCDDPGAPAVPQLVLPDGQAYTGCDDILLTGGGDACFTCCFDIRAEQDALLAFATGVASLARVALA